jgi:hypothetical protein
MLVITEGYEAEESVGRSTGRVQDPLAALESTCFTDGSVSLTHYSR